MEFNKYLVDLGALIELGKKDELDSLVEILGGPKKIIKNLSILEACLDGMFGPLVYFDSIMDKDYEVPDLFMVARLIKFSFGRVKVDEEVEDFFKRYDSVIENNPDLIKCAFLIFIYTKRFDLIKLLGCTPPFVLNYILSNFNRLQIVDRSDLNGWLVNEIELLLDEERFEYEFNFPAILDRADYYLSEKYGYLALAKKLKTAFDKNKSPYAIDALIRLHISNKNFPRSIEELDKLIALILEVNSKKSSLKIVAQESIYNDYSAFSVLKDLLNIMYSSGIKAFPVSGTLLGLIRHGKLLEYDKDIDVAVIGWEQQFDVAKALLSSRKFSFNVDRIKGEELYLLPVVHNQTGLPIDFFFLHENGEYFEHSVQSRLGYNQYFKFSKFGLISKFFSEQEILIPDNFELNLKENYGTDWKFPDEDYVVLVESPAIVDKESIEYLFSCMLMLKEIVLKGSKSKAKRVLKAIEGLESNEVKTVIHQLNSLEAVAAWMTTGNIN